MIRSFLLAGNTRTPVDPPPFLRVSRTDTSESHVGQLLDLPHGLLAVRRHTRRFID